MHEDISVLRNDYRKQRLNREDLSPDPIAQFQTWLSEAIKSKVLEPTAMTLATVSLENKPSARIVLLKNVSHNGFTFFTNYQSRKGQEILENPLAALVLYWHELERQVRIEGKVLKIDDDESTKYFDARPEPSKISAIISPQSKAIPNRAYLEKKVDEFRESNVKIKKPSFWGGFLVVPQKIEFWQGRENRLHDRFLYEKRNSVWEITRLAP